MLCQQSNHTGLWYPRTTDNCQTSQATAKGMTAASALNLRTHTQHSCCASAAQSEACCGPTPDMATIYALTESGYLGWYNMPCGCGAAAVCGASTAWFGPPSITTASKAHVFLVNMPEHGAWVTTQPAMDHDLHNIHVTSGTACRASSTPWCAVTLKTRTHASKADLLQFTCPPQTPQAPHPAPPIKLMLY